MIDWSAIWSAVGVGAVLLIAVCGVYIKIGDRIDRTKDSLSEKCENIRDDIATQSTAIGRLEGTVKSLNGIHEAYNARFENIESSTREAHQRIDRMGEKKSREG